jgi:hypothetical protein
MADDKDVADSSDGSPKSTFRRILKIFKVEDLWDLITKTDRRSWTFILSVVAVLLVYPFYVVSVTLYLIGLAPKTVQMAVNKYVLDSIGATDEANALIKTNNGVIDSFIPMKVVLSEPIESLSKDQPKFYQTLTPNQRATFDVTVIHHTLREGARDPICVSAPDDQQLGRLKITVIQGNSDDIAPRKISLGPNSESHKVDELKKEEWDKVIGRLPNRDDYQFVLTVDTAGIAPDVTSYIDKCLEQVEILINMTVYKTRVEAKIAASSGGAP